MAGKILMPNEDGVLVPTDAASYSTPHEAQRELSLAISGGGSGLGMSHYSLASRCGRKARLNMERNKRFEGVPSAIPESKSYFIVGSVYHRLHELARNGKSAEMIFDFDEQYGNPNVAEGIRLYKGWLRHWGLSFWGDTIAVEEHFTDEETFAPATVTAAIDMVVEMDQEACERAAVRGLDLEPGIYCLDWKTADNPTDGVQYSEGLQALWYVYAWNKFNPDRQAKGIIFDVILKRSRRKDRNVARDDFQAFYIPYGLESVATLAGMVAQGYRNVEEDIANRSECCTFRGEICSYRTSGACDGT